MTGEWARWRRRLAELERLAGDGVLDTVTPLTVGPVVDRATVDLVVREAGELPADYRSLVTNHAGRIEFCYRLPGGAAPRGALVDAVDTDLVGSRTVLVDVAATPGVTRYAALFGGYPAGPPPCGLTFLATTQSDDFVAVRHDTGELVLAHHDDMPLTPGDLDEATQRLAGSFTELIDRWSELCFPEPSVLLDHHLARGVGEVDLRCPASRSRLRLFGG